MNRPPNIGAAAAMAGSSEDLPPGHLMKGVRRGGKWILLSGNSTGASSAIT
jgi:hypothetical protein